MRYDVYTLGKHDGRKTWWEGLDPRDLYTGSHAVLPDGMDSIAAMNAWHDAHGYMTSNKPCAKH